MTIDAADFSIISGRLLAVAEEMGDSLLRAAYSTIVREAKDCSTCVTDRLGRMVAQSQMIPVHMNSLAAAMEYALRKYDCTTLKPGEALITNNPYEAAQHLNDIIVVLPVFHEGRLAAFAGSICHHLEVGGAVPGSNANATDLYQEGLVLPTMRVDLRKDLEGGPIEQILAANVRMPEIVIGDFRAQVSALLRGEALIHELFARYGEPLVAEVMSEMQNYAERMMRAAIDAIPDGEYFGEDVFDGSHLGDPKVTVRARIEVTGSNAIVDLTATDDQVAWPVNAPVASTKSAVLTLFGLLMGRNVPVNDGTYRPISIITRKGSAVDPIHPAPVRGRMTSIYRVFTAAKRALGAAIPRTVAAAGNDCTNAVTFSYRSGNRQHMFTDMISGGYGAGHETDGAEAVSQSLSNTSNTPVEALEMNHAFIRVLSYGLMPDSGGPGGTRGGLGVRRVYEVLEDGVLLSTNGDRHESCAWGFEGGHSSPSSSYIVLRGNEEMRLPAASNTMLRKGDRFIATICGGGGYGNPKDRDRALVLADVKSGRISASAARNVYGIADSDLVDPPHSETASSPAGRGEFA